MNITPDIVTVFFEIPNTVSAVYDVLKQHSFEAYIVGGSVRDLLISRLPKDWDITTNALPDQIIGIFEATGYKVVYENEFGTVSVIIESEPQQSNLREIQITSYRKDIGVYDNRHPRTIEFSDNVQTDIMRRDFTMNGLLYDIETNQLIDYVGGIKDILLKRIQTIGKPKDRFNEDALRILRAIRFMAQLDFEIDETVKNEIISMSDLIKNVSRERIRDEFIKIIESDNAKKALIVSYETHILHNYLPELAETYGVFQGGNHTYDVFHHLIEALHNAVQKKYILYIRLAALFHDIGKPATAVWSAEKNKNTFYGHEVVGSKIAKKILTNLKFDTETIYIVTKLVRYHMFFSDTETITLSAVRRIIVNVGPDNIWDLMKVRECDRVGMKKCESPYRLRKYFSMIEQCLRDPISVKQLSIDGNDLKSLDIETGPKMGMILSILLDLVLDKPELNTREILLQKALDFNSVSYETLVNLFNIAKSKINLQEKDEIQNIDSKFRI